MSIDTTVMVPSIHDGGGPLDLDLLTGDGGMITGMVISWRASGGRTFRVEISANRGPLTFHPESGPTLQALTDSVPK